MGMLVTSMVILSLISSTSAVGVGLMLAFAAAIGIMVGAIWLLSSIDGSRLIGAGLALLSVVGILTVMSLALSAASGVIAIGAVILVAFSAAILMFATGLLILSKVNYPPMVSGLGILFGLIGGLGLGASLNMIALSVGMTVFGAASLIMGTGLISLGIGAYLVVKAFSSLTNSLVKLDEMFNKGMTTQSIKNMG